MSSENKTDTGANEIPKSYLSLDYRRHAKAAVYDGLNDYDEVLAQARDGKTDGPAAEGISFEPMTYAEAEELSEQAEEPGFGETDYGEDGETGSDQPDGPEDAGEEADDRIAHGQEVDDRIAAWECSRCGSKILGAKDFKGFLCPFCGGLMEVDERNRVDTWASWIVPFRKTREDAVEAFRQMERRGLIRISKSPVRMERSIYGMYVPFYLCSGDVSGRVDYRRNYRGTQTMPLRLNRFGGVTLKGVPQDAMSELPDTMVDTIGPFDIRSKEPFRSGRLTEHPATVATETVRGMSGRIRAKMESAARSAFVLDQEEPDGMTARKSRLRTTNMDFERAYLPVFFSVASHGDRKVWFVMNGQTGRAAVLEPVSEERMERYCRWSMGLTYALSALLMILFLILEFLSIRAGYAWAAAVLTVMIGISANLSIRGEIRRKRSEWREGVAIDALWYAHRVDFRDDF